MAYVDENREQIIEIISGWQGKLTWSELASDLQKKFKLHKKPSRHTLILYDDIKHAFDLKKKTLKEKKEDMLHRVKVLDENPNELEKLLSNFSSDDATIMALIKQNKELSNENEKLKFKCEQLEASVSILMEQFVRWQSNLSKMDGVDMNKLLNTIDEPLSEKNIR